MRGALGSSLGAGLRGGRGWGWGARREAGSRRWTLTPAWRRLSQEARGPRQTPQRLLSEWTRSTSQPHPRAASAPRAADRNPSAVGLFSGRRSRRGLCSDVGLSGVCRLHPGLTCHAALTTGMTGHGSLSLQWDSGVCSALPPGAPGWPEPLPRRPVDAPCAGSFPPPPRSAPPRKPWHRLSCKLLSPKSVSGSP